MMTNAFIKQGPWESGLKAIERPIYKMQGAFLKGARLAICTTYYSKGVWRDGLPNKGLLFSKHNAAEKVP